MSESLETVAVKAWPFIKDMLEREALRLSRETTNPQEAGVAVKAALSLIDTISKELELSRASSPKAYSAGRLKS